MGVFGGWVSQDRKYVWHPFTQMQTAPPPIPIERAEGIYLHTHDGRRLLDGISSWWVNIHGHNHPRLNRALEEQASRLSHVLFAGCTHEPAARLASELVRRAPAGLTRVFFSDNGSTSVEVALKMSYQYWKNRGETRDLFISLKHAYHGDTLGAMGVGGVDAFHAQFADLLVEQLQTYSPTCRTCPVGRTRATCRIECSGRLEDLLRESGHRVAAVIVEPMVQGAGGMIIWPVEFLNLVRELTRRHGTLLIADEVFTGFGRTGKMFACEHGPVTPDLMCLSKALTGGYLPLAATLVTEPLYQAFLSEDRGRGFLHGHSYTANPLGCAVALESLSLFDEEERLERVARLEALFSERLARVARLPGVAEVRGIGGLAVMELEADGDAGYLDSRSPRLIQAFLEKGLLLRPLGNVLYFLPPYVIEDREVHRAFDVIEEVLVSIVQR